MQLIWWSSPAHSTIASILYIVNITCWKWSSSLWLRNRPKHFGWNIIESVRSPLKFMMTNLPFCVAQPEINRPLSHLSVKVHSQPQLLLLTGGRKFSYSPKGESGTHIHPPLHRLLIFSSVNLLPVRVYPFILNNFMDSVLLLFSPVLNILIALCSFLLLDAWRWTGERNSNILRDNFHCTIIIYGINMQIILMPRAEKKRWIHSVFFFLLLLLSCFLVSVSFRNCLHNIHIYMNGLGLVLRIEQSFMVWEKGLSGSSRLTNH